jgi:DNA-binding NarL/FixJ family response regulator
MAQIKNRPDKDARRRVLVVDDHAVVRYGITQLLNREGDLVVCGEEEDAGCALDAIRKLSPDLVVADLSLKDSSGLELARNIRAEFPSLPILVVSAHDESLYADVALRAGAMGYLMKDDALEKVVDAARRVLSGDVYLSQTQTARMLLRQHRTPSAPSASPVEVLTDRELDVFQLIGRWKRTGEIAKELHLSVKTIEYYRDQIKRKLNLSSAAELTQFATTWAQRELPV